MKEHKMGVEVVALVSVQRQSSEASFIIIIATSAVAATFLPRSVSAAPLPLPSSQDQRFAVLQCPQCRIPFLLYWVLFVSRRQRHQGSNEKWEMGTHRLTCQEKRGYNGTSEKSAKTEENNKKREG